MTNTSADNDESINIYDQEELQNFISSSTKDITNSDVKKILYVHVGVQILSLQFTSRNTVDISGFIWQKTPIDRSNNISYDFFLPGSAGNAKIEKVFERKRNNFMTILYEFSTKLQYSDTGAQYPFDKSKIELSIWPKEFDQHTIFIPDFMAYDYLDPAMKPGIITKNITGNWEISKSYFSFVPYPLDASLGYLEYMKRHIKPYILTYNIKVKRNIWPPFISNILPCIIIAILVFMLISFFARNKEKLNDTGTVFHSLRYFGGLLIFVALMHGKLSITGTGEISYIEYCYLLIYICIFLAMYYAISLKQYDNVFIAFIKKYNVIELIYWPLLLFAFLLLTLFIFW